MSALAVLLVFAGAGCGALLRWYLGIRLNPVLPTLPLGTLAANLIGGLRIGLALAYFSRHPGAPPEVRLLVITGFLGGLTTFSTSSGEVDTQVTRGECLWGLTTAAAHLAGSLLLTALGRMLAKRILARA